MTTVRKSIFLFLILTALIFVVASCQAIMNVAYGMKNPEPVDEKTILHYSKKFKIPIADSYELDTSYISFLTSLDTIHYKSQRKNHYQPLQVLYYDKSSQLQSFQVNCYAGGFPNLQWNKNEIFTTFPPGQQAPLDSILPYDNHLKYVRPLSQTISFSADSYDYIVMVYWNEFMGRQSSRLIRYVQDNSKLVTDKKVKIIYVNNDNMVSESLDR